MFLFIVDWIKFLFWLKTYLPALAGVAQLDGVSSCKLKCWGSDSRSGHMPRLRVLSLVGAHGRCNQSMCLSLSRSLESLSALSKINKCILRWGLKTKQNKTNISSYHYESWYCPLSHFLHKRTQELNKEACLNFLLIS